MFEMSDKTVGIDLGTTFSVVAHLDADQRPVTIPNDEGDLSTPSIVFFDREFTVVGKEAANAGELEPERVCRFAKRDMGEDSYNRQIQGRSYPPEVLQALILGKLKNDAEFAIGEFSKAVITVPAYFNEPRRKATQDAGKLAGLDVLDIINEPTAAAFAYGVKEGFVDREGNASDNERILVYDLGGGTFDVTLMEIKGREFDVMGTAGDVHLGGIDWDNRIAEHFAHLFTQEHKVDPSDDFGAMQKLQVLASRAKKTLSTRLQSQIRFGHAGFQSRFDLTRDEFNDLTEDLVERTRMTLQRLLRDAGMAWNDVTRLLLVGGSTRMPMIQSMLAEESQMPLDRSLSPDEAVAHGAAIYADILQNTGEGKPRFQVSSVNSHDLGVLGVNPKTKEPKRRIMIPRNTKIPARKKSQFVTSRESQKEVLVTVVEGGTENGTGATVIGRCRISGLPEGLEQGAAVNVTFKYLADGRINVSGEIPSINVRAQTVIERASGMSDGEIARWQSEIENGIAVGDDDTSEGNQFDNVGASDSTVKTQLVRQSEPEKRQPPPIPKPIKPNQPSKQKSIEKPKITVAAPIISDSVKPIDPSLSTPQISASVSNPDEVRLDELEFLEESGKPKKEATEEFSIHADETPVDNAEGSRLDSFLGKLKP